MAKLRLLLRVCKSTKGSAETEPAGVADYSYANIDDFKVEFQSETRATLRFFYTYRGFILSDTDSDVNGISDNSLAGQFVTDIIAKNHHTGEGVANYGETTSTIARL